MSLALVGGSQVGETIRTLTEGPRLADLGAIERRMGEVMELWLAVQSAARAYEAVVAGAWAEANQRFADRVPGAGPQAGTAPTQPRRRSSSGSTSPTRPCSRPTGRSEFLTAQSQLLRQGMDFLLAEREMVEALVEPAGLPTRTEIDEVHRSRARAQAPCAHSREGCRRSRAAGPAARGSQTACEPAKRRIGRPGMIPMPAVAGTAELMRAAADLQRQGRGRGDKLGTIKDEQVQIATTPKDEVFRTDKVTLYRYRAAGRAEGSRLRC